MENVALIILFVLTIINLVLTVKGNAQIDSLIKVYNESQKNDDDWWKKGESRDE